MCILKDVKKKGCPYTFKGDARVGQSHPVLLTCKGILSVALYQWHARGGINYLPLEILYLGLDVVIFEGYLNNMSESHCALFPCVWKNGRISDTALHLLPQRHGFATCETPEWCLFSTVPRGRGTDGLLCRWGAQPAPGYHPGSAHTSLSSCRKYTLFQRQGTFKRFKLVKFRAVLQANFHWVLFHFRSCIMHEMAHKKARHNESNSYK